MTSRPGSYEFVLQANSETLDPGEVFSVAIFFSGLGIIELAKLFSGPPPGVFDDNECYVTSGFGPDPANPSRIILGGHREKVGSAMLLELGAKVKAPNGKVIATLFSPIPGRSRDDSLQIVAETTNPNPPLALDFTVAKKCRPGKYSIPFVLTFFDGDQWISKKEIATITVRGLFQRLEGVIAWGSVVALGVTIAAGIISGLGDLGGAWDQVSSWFSNSLPQRWFRTLTS